MSQYGSVPITACQQSNDPVNSLCVTCQDSHMEVCFEGLSLLYNDNECLLLLADSAAGA